MSCCKLWKKKMCVVLPKSAPLSLNSTGLYSVLYSPLEKKMTIASKLSTYHFLLEYAM